MDVLKLAKYIERSYEEVTSNKGWVNYGDDNLYPQYLVDLYKQSATHNALCNSISMMIFGKGFDAPDLDTKLKIQELGLDMCMRKAILDLKIQGGFALEVIYSLDRETVSDINHMPFETIRSGECDEYERIHEYYYCRDWSDSRARKVKMCAFDPQKKVEHPRQLLYVNPFSPGSFYYPKPDYIGSVNYIELDKEIGKYHINNIRNGLAPSFSIHFKNGIPSPEERMSIRNDLERQLSGATNAGKFIVTYSDDPDRKPDFEPFPLSDADKQYEFLSTEVTDKIMVGHRVVSPAMFGVKTAGQLGTTQELDIASQLFDRQVVQPHRRVVLDAVQRLMMAADVDPSVVIGDFDSISVVEEAPAPATAMAKTEQVNLALDTFMSHGEDVDESWELIDEREVDYDREEEMNQLWEFTRVPSSDADGDSVRDNDVVKIRYFYDGAVTDRTRDFCRKMVQAGKVYRKEDIDAASQTAVNPGWGPNGADTYDIWLYKGGGDCHHRWIRRTYLVKDNKQVSVAEAKRIISKLPIAERAANRIPTEDGRVSQMPYTMPNRGYLPTNPKVK